MQHVERRNALAAAAFPNLRNGPPPTGLRLHMILTELGSPVLTGAMFAQAAQRKLSHLLYRGSALAMQNLLGGQIDALSGDLAGAQPVDEGGLSGASIN